MKKIIATISLITLLFIVSFVLQSKYNTVILNSVNVHGTQALFLKQIHLAGTSFLFMDLLTTSIIVCFGIMIVILIFVLLNRKRMEKRERIRNSYLERYQQMLLSYLMVIKSYPNDIKREETDHIRNFKKLANTRFKRQLLVDTFADVNLNLKGDTSRELKELFFKLKLHKLTYKKMRSYRWHKKIKGFKELYAMNITDKNNVLYKYINSRNELVAIEAQIALVDLSKEDPDALPFDFLGELKTPFRLWEQITLHQVMVDRDIKVPDFGKWVLSENPTVCMFCLRMIREYRQVQNADKINYLMYYNNISVRKLAIQVAGDLKLENVAYTLKKVYKDETYENSLEIIKALGKIVNFHTIGFLQKVVDAEDDTQKQIEAVKAIYNMGEIGKTYLQKMMNSNYKDYNIIIKHVLDKRIN
jgi:hypothetical protein